MSEVDLPPPGVSEVTSGGGAVQGAAPAPVRAATVAPPKRTNRKMPPKKPRNRRPGEDVLRPELLEQLQAEKISGGDAVVDRLGSKKRPSRSLVTYTSVDGQSYSFKIPKNPQTRKRVVPQLAVLLAVRELCLGGDGIQVFNKFKINQTDLDKKVLFPIASPTALPDPNTIASMMLGEEGDEDDYMNVDVG